MSDDLVKRLRDWEHVWPEDDGEPEGNLYIAAADRIEELEHLLKQERKAHEKEVYVWQDNYAALEAKLSESEALLAKAVDTLMFYGGVMPNAFLPIHDGGEKARTTFAELKGEK